MVIIKVKSHTSASLKIGIRCFKVSGLQGETDATNIQTGITTQ